MTGKEILPNTSQLPEIEQFRILQSTLRERWKPSEIFDNSETDILIIPSLSIDQRELEKVPGCEHYEERLLFSLIRLRNPRNRLGIACFQAALLQTADRCQA